MLPLFFLFGLLLTSPSYAEDLKWTPLDRGIELAEVRAPTRSVSGDSLFTMVRIDPEYYEFRLLAASELGESKTIREWAQEYNLAAAINAGMYATDMITSVGYLKNYDHVNNPRMAKNYNAILAFHPLAAEKGLPQVQIIDRTCQEWKLLVDKYATLVQNFRLIDCKRKSTWSPSRKIWSTALLGQDSAGRIIMIFSRSPYSTHDMINMLLALPIDLQRGMYLEGGKEATLYLNIKGRVIEKVGSFGSSEEKVANKRPWPIPNVIGVVKKSQITKAAGSP